MSKWLPIESAPSFKALGWFRIKGRGWVASVECDKERPRDGSGLMGATVLIDGEPFKVCGVERHMPASPIRAGEKIGLLVGDLEQEGLAMGPPSHEVAITTNHPGDES